MADPLRLNESILDDGAVQVIEVAGPVRLDNMFQLQTLVRGDSSARGLVLGLAGVPYMDSAGLGVIINAHISCQKKGRALALAGVTERVRSLMGMTKVDTLFTFADSVEQAREQLRAARTNA